jgi:hypothetical protein
MPLNKLDNFIRNVEGRLLYVNPSDINSTDSVSNDGTSLTTPFKTIQRALLEAARFSYVRGDNNDLIEKTSILLYPGEHLVDNRPGYAIYDNGGAKAVSRTGIETPAINEFSLLLDSNFDLTQENNILYKFNSFYGGIVVPRGTSIIGLDLRKTKIRPKYVPNPTDSSTKNSAIFRITGACYFWQFSIFDADENTLAYTQADNFGSPYLSKPTFSHHKLTCFEYADGVNKVQNYGLTDLDMYYSKVSNAYNAYRAIDQKFPGASEGFAKRSQEWEIVGAFSPDPLRISSIGNGGSGSVITVSTLTPHNFNEGTPIKIRGVTGAVSDAYNISTKVQEILSPTSFLYSIPSIPVNFNPTPSAATATVTVEVDTVSGASPYIFNCSLRSVWGMNGLHGDGSKASGFRSTVVAQFTAISLQKDDRAFVKYNPSLRIYEPTTQPPVVYGADLATQSASTVSSQVYHLDPEAIYRKGWESSHIKVSNDSFSQIVSVFAIGFNKHFDVETGGDASITNSNSNFGQISLNSSGFRKDAFGKDDQAYITSIITPRSISTDESVFKWLPLDVDLTTTIGITSHLYIYGYKSVDNPPLEQVQGCKIGGRISDRLYLKKGANNYSALIYMCDNDVSSSGLTTALGTTSSFRSFRVTSGPTSNSFTIGSNTLLSGEKVKVISNDGDLPENLEAHQTYYVIKDGSTAIKLSSSYTSAINGQALDVYGGTNLRVISRVSDKVSGEPGSPIQFDNQNDNWFVHVNANNQIYSAFESGGTETFGTASDLVYVNRIIDDRSLDEKLYKMRVIIPKEVENSRNPDSGFIIQESSATGVRTDTDFTKTTLDNSDFNFNRNPRFLATVSVASTTVTSTAELPHNLQVNDVVVIKNVTCSNNTTGSYNVGYNGRFVVRQIVDDFSFRYFTTDTDGGVHVPGTFTNNVNARTSSLPRFERKDLKSNLFVYRSEVVSPYIYNKQDGIYHLYVLNSSNRVPTEFTDLEFGQLPTDLYPQLDRDNIDSNPPAAKTFAKRAPVGDVITNDLKNSITRETVDTTLQKLGIGLTISTVSSTTTSAVITFGRRHGLSGIATYSTLVGGSGHTPGAGSTTYYNVKLFNENTLTNWDGATTKVTVTNGVVTASEIISGGSGYVTGETLYFDTAKIGGTANAYITITNAGISTNVGDVIQLTGIGTTSDGYYRITSVGSATSISIAKTSGDPVILSSQYGLVVRPSAQVTDSVYDSTSGITTFTTSSSHGLLVGNRFKIINTNNSNIGEYIVAEKIGVTQFNAVTNTGVSTNAVYVLPHGLSSNDAPTDSSNENFGVRNLTFFDNQTFTLTSAITTGTSISISNSGIGTATRLSLGSYIQIDNEIMRVASSNNVTSATVIRGVFGTRQENHAANSLIRKINPVPIEFRRPSILRASGHTFEYLGYGPGNYSTGLPQVQVKSLSDRESLLAQSQERSGGVVVYTGMNNNGDFFNGNTKTSSSSGEVISYDIPNPTVTGEESSKLSSIFDKVTIKNGLFVEGGASGTVLSQFDGPVTFNNQIKVNAESTFKRVEVDEAIRAETYENFKLSDLPTNDEVTYGAEKVLKVNSSATGYELVDIVDLDTYRLQSYGLSNDPTVYVGVTSIVSGKTRISGISTSKFLIGEKVKVFGITTSTDSLLVPNPEASSFEKVGTSATVSTYRYWTSQYHLRNGKVGISSQLTPTQGIGMTSIDNFNDQDNIALTLARTDTNHGILVYRQIGVSTDIDSAKLVGILGPKELESNTSNIRWIDFGVYEQPEWSPKGTVNEYNSNQIHFPNIATTGHKRGWAIDEIVSIGASSITLNNQYNGNTGSEVKVVHDNTYAFSRLIDAVTASGKNSIDLPSGTYLTNKLIVPTNFTISGGGKNSVVKLQYFANDSTDGAGNSLSLDGNMVGFDTTNPSNITMQNITFDGNNGNNILFSGEIDNYLVYCDSISSSLIKNIEIRNSPGHGLYVDNSQRLSIENSSFVDGSITERYVFQPLSAEESQSLRLNDCLFENYPGPVNLSASSVVSTGGNIIRNCGTGLRVYATGKITTTNNIILGPSDEWIPSPDIYDSDYNSVNVAINTTTDFTGPTLLYLEDGIPKDLSSTKVSISAGIGTIVGQGSTTTPETLGSRFMYFNIQNPDQGAFGRQNGYILPTLNLAQTSTLGLSSALGYDIRGTEYINIPAGFTTYIGIGSGAWYKDGSPFIGAGATQYIVTLADPEQFSGIATGDVVKLVDHSVSPDLSANQLTVAQKIVSGLDRGLVLVGIATSSVTNGDETGYISIRRTFTIAKGRVGVI